MPYDTNEMKLLRGITLMKSIFSAEIQFLCRVLNNAVR